MTSIQGHDSSSASSTVVRPSREEIESLCILHAVGPNGCSVEALVARLGFSPDLAPALSEAIAPLLAEGRLVDADGTVYLTDAGDAWLRQRLSELLDCAARKGEGRCH